MEKENKVPAEKEVRWAQLVGEFKKCRSDASFEALYKNSYSKLYGYVFSLGRNKELAERAAQSGFVKCCEKIDQLEDGSRFVPWMRQICYREYLSLLKKQARTVGFAGVSEDGEEEDPLAKIPDDGSIGMPEDGVEKEELQKLLMEAFDSLPELQRLSIISFYYDKKDIGFIAKELGVPENTVKSYLSRGRKAMNLKMQDYATAYDLKLVPFAIVPAVREILNIRVQTGEMAVTEEMINYSLASVKKKIASLCAEKLAAAKTSADAGMAKEALSSGAKASGTLTGGAARRVTEAGTAAGKTVSIKLIAGIVAAVVACGGGAAAIILNRQSAENHRTLSETAEIYSSAGDFASDEEMISDIDTEANSRDEDMDSSFVGLGNDKPAAKEEASANGASVREDWDEDLLPEENEPGDVTDAVNKEQEAASAAYQDVIDIIRECGDDPYDSAEASGYMDYFPMALQYDTATHGYAFMDLDGDGADEMLLTEGTGLSQTDINSMDTDDCLHAGAYIYAILSYRNGQVVPIVSQGGSRDSYFLCRDGMIGHYASGGVGLWGYEFYQISGKELRLQESVFRATLVDEPTTDEEINDIRCFYTTSAPFEDKSTEISEEEYEEVLQRHAYKALTPTPIS